MTEEEIWKPWPKNPKYLVSSKGRIKGKSGKILTQILDISRGGYYQVNIDKPNTINQRTKAYVHRILMETFNPIENMENLIVDHIDGIRTNNNLNNLRWVTEKENQKNKNINRVPINKEIQRLIQKYGYEETLELLQKL